MLVATVIHTQEVSNQHVPSTTVHCEGENTEHGGLRPTPQTQPGSDAPRSRDTSPGHRTHGKLRICGLK